MLTPLFSFFFFNDTATTEIYTLSLHDALPICFLIFVRLSCGGQNRCCRPTEEAHQSLDVLSYRCQEELLAHEPESPQAQAPLEDFLGPQLGYHLSRSQK